MRQYLRIILLVALFAALGSGSARAGEVALLLEQPYGRLGAMDPLGHAAIYLSDVCAETPVSLRRCDPGERGVVISRYHKVDGYDWVAMPLLPYLYGVRDPGDIPAEGSRSLAVEIRDQYRREYLREYVPDDPDRKIPKGDWTQLLGESYLRKIYGYSLVTTPEQDDALIAKLNTEKNRSSYNLAFRNCANFAEDILNFYYPHSVHRNFIADLGFMTPKQTAHALEKYAKRHPDLEFATFVIPQLPGKIHRSSSIHGILDSVLETKKYVLPLAILHPAVAGSLIAVYLGGGRFHPGSRVEAVFDPRLQLEPGVMDEASAPKRPPNTPGEMNTARSSAVAITNAAFQPRAPGPSQEPGSNALGFCPGNGHGSLHTQCVIH